MNTALILAFAELAASRAGCRDFRDQLWVRLQDIAIDASHSHDRTTPGIDAEIEARLLHWHPSMDAASRTRISTTAARLVRTVSFDLPRTLGASARADILEVLTAAEYGDAVSPIRTFVRDRVETGFHALEVANRDARTECAGGETAPAPVAFASVAVSDLARNGGRKSFATMYQSCAALDVDALTSATPDVKGITIRGTHDDKIGSKRYITDRQALLNSHPYIRSPESGCRDVRQNPPIYDYGGRPYAGTAASAPLDFFTDSGSGTTVLGIDCSAYIFTALASKGLKVKASAPLKASGVYAYNTSSFFDPAHNGMDCIERIRFVKGTKLQVGDMIVVRGHIVMVDRVGDDPFGIAKIARLEDCKNAGDVRNLDFTILQSSSSVGGIGMNRAVASDYMAGHSKFSEGLKLHAVQACRARFGASVTVPSDAQAYVIRHKGTSECRAQPVRLIAGECADRCVP